MCKKLLSGLLGKGGDAPSAPAAAPTAATDVGANTTVKSEVAPEANKATGVNIGVVTDDRKRRGVPGLSL